MGGPEDAPDPPSRLFMFKSGDGGATWETSIISSRPPPRAENGPPPFSFFVAFTTSGVANATKNGREGAPVGIGSHQLPILRLLDSSEIRMLGDQLEPLSVE